MLPEKIDLRDLEWGSGQYSDGQRYTSRLATMTRNGRQYYLKLSSYDAENGVFTGHESLNEVVVSRFLDLLGIEHTKYEPVYADILLDGRERTALLCCSEDFCAPDETRESLDVCFGKHSLPGESPLDFCKRIGIADYIYRMLFVDYLIMNRDRYAYNIEILTNEKGLRPAPLFDHGLSLLCKCRTEEEMQAFDVMKDDFSLAYIGIWRVGKNLNLIPDDRFDELCPPVIEVTDSIFDGLEEMMSPVHRRKILEMLNRRLLYLQSEKNRRWLQTRP